MSSFHAPADVEQQAEVQRRRGAGRRRWRSSWIVWRLAVLEDLEVVARSGPVTRSPRLVGDGDPEVHQVDRGR